MDWPKPTTQRMAIEADSSLAGLVEPVRRGKQRIILEQDGEPVAVLVSVRDFERLEFFEKKWNERTAVFEKVGAAFKDVPVEEIEREVAKALAEVRAEERLRQQAEAERA